MEHLGLRYLICGSVAAMLYGEPRVTHDIDLIVFLTSEDAGRLRNVFPFPDFYLPPPEIISSELAKESKGQFNIIHTETGLKADIFTVGKDELHAWAFRNGREYSIGNLSIKLAPPEYVIIRKLEYFREGGSGKHLRDIRAMLEVSGDLIRRSELEEWIRRRELNVEWNQAMG